MRAGGFSRQLLVFGWLILLPWQSAARENINIAMMDLNRPSREVMLEVGRDFERMNPNYRVNFTFLHDAPYKANIETWLQNRAYDVYYWQAGERLNRFARQGWVASIDDLWNDNGLDALFASGTRELVSFNDATLAIPYSFQHWGIFYRISLFLRLNITPPKNWEDLLKISEILKKNGVKPLIIATKYQWPSVAWFSHLNLRINGIEFHRQLMDGKAAYTDPRVVQVFEHWKLLLDRDFFIDDPSQYSSQEALPLFYKKSAAMYLTGNFITQHMNKTLLSDIGYIRFPDINPDIPPYEEMPLDVFFMPAKARNPTASYKMLLHLADANTQEKINKAQFTLPANRHAAIADDRFARYGLKLLSESRDVSLFYDRETRKQVSDSATRLMSNFLYERDIERVTSDLEAVRLQVYGAL